MVKAMLVVLTAAIGPLQQSLREELNREKIAEIHYTRSGCICSRNIIVSNVYYVMMLQE